jgi:hypothetical protein
MAYHREYHKLWADADYPPGMASAGAVKPPPKECRPAYHFIEAEHAIEDIENGRIKVTRVSEANDPFEFEAYNVNMPHVRSAIRTIKAEMDANLSLLCFSKNWASAALWAHYARKHTGICLGFWAKRDTLLDVIYCKDRVDGGFNGQVVLSPKMRELLVTVKAKVWEYEGEIRRCVSLDETVEAKGKRFFRFDDTLKLSEVILGEKCIQKLDDIRVLVRKVRWRTCLPGPVCVGIIQYGPERKDHSRHLILTCPQSLNG